MICFLTINNKIVARDNLATIYRHLVNFFSFSKSYQALHMQLKKKSLYIAVVDHTAEYKEKNRTTKIVYPVNISIQIDEHELQENKKKDPG